MHNNLSTQFSHFGYGFVKISQRMLRICFKIFPSARLKSGNCVTKIIMQDACWRFFVALTSIKISMKF